MDYEGAKVLYGSCYRQRFTLHGPGDGAISHNPKLVRGLREDDCLVCVKGILCCSEFLIIIIIIITLFL